MPRDFNIHKLLFLEDKAKDISHPDNVDCLLNLDSFFHQEFEYAMCVTFDNE